MVLVKPTILLAGLQLQLRGWDVISGLQTEKKLEELGLKDVGLIWGKDGLQSDSD